MAAFLGPGGIAVIDAWQPQPDDLVSLFDEAAPGGPPARWTRTDRLRLVSADELVEAAEAAGLEIERLAGDYELGPFGPSSERAVVVARKPG